MKLTCRLVDGVQLVTLTGGLLKTDALFARTQFKKLITKNSPFVVINLEQLNFIDARGLSVFLSALKMAKQFEGDVLLLNPSTTVCALIELTRLQHTFCIYLDEAAAIEYCKSRLSPTQLA